MKIILLAILSLSFCVFSQSDSNQKLYDYLKKHGQAQMTDRFDIVEKDGLICRIMVGGFSGKPQCGLNKDKSKIKTSSVAKIMKDVLGTTISEDIRCVILTDDEMKNFQKNHKCHSNNSFEGIKEEKRCRFLQDGFVRIHRPSTKSCSKDSSICLATIQCKGQGPSSAACAPKNGACGMSIEECISDKEVQLYKKYGMGALDEEEPMGGSRSGEQ